VGGAERSRRVLRVTRAMRVLPVMRVIAAVNRRGGGGSGECSGEWRWQVGRGTGEADASYLGAHRLGRVESVTLVTLSPCSHRSGGWTQFLHGIQTLPLRKHVQSQAHRPWKAAIALFLVAIALRGVSRSEMWP
jgi:hypothetical protein